MICYAAGALARGARAVTATMTMMWCGGYGVQNAGATGVLKLQYQVCGVCVCVYVYVCLVLARERVPTFATDHARARRICTTVHKTVYGLGHLAYKKQTHKRTTIFKTPYVMLHGANSVHTYIINCSLYVFI